MPDWVSMPKIKPKAESALVEESLLDEETILEIKRRGKRVPSNYELGFDGGYNAGFRAGMDEALRLHAELRKMQSTESS